MQIYRSITALSGFRTKKLLSSLQKIDSKITGIRAEYIHFADVSGKITETSNAELVRLLTYGTPLKTQEDGELFLVVPRTGTISPWSSKATDIAQNAGLNGVKRIERGIAIFIDSESRINRAKITPHLHDRMTEEVFSSIRSAEILFTQSLPKKLETVEILRGGVKALSKASQKLGLALTVDEIDYLVAAYKKMKRNPTDIELTMFAQVNSEHCRHKIFNADWIVEGKKQPKSLFKMIKNTYEIHSTDVLSAYSDNAAVLRGAKGGRFFANPKTKVYSYHREPIHSVIKVETHNHPTAIAPHPGAGTGVGGEIRDEGATGCGARPKMGLAGYTVSNLLIPGAEQPWEKNYGKPERIVSALEIMLESPIGAAGYANEFGRPNLLGYFRTFEQAEGSERWGYHKPIMIAGGLGNIRDEHVKKRQLPPGAQMLLPSRSHSRVRAAH